MMAWCSNLGAEYPSPKRVNLFNYGRIINPKRLKVTYSATKIKSLVQGPRTARV